MDTGYPALTPDIPTEKLSKNGEKLQPPTLDDPSPPVILEEQVEDGTAK